jgi:hypothetical protein
LHRVSLTAAGVEHPVMQLAPNAADTRKRWDAVPALASIAQLGGPRPGASVLAVASGQGGTPRALVAVQRYGEGRAMVFAGEASWRWRMLLPATDRAYDTFWKQAIRWLALPAGDPVGVSAAPGAAPGDTIPVQVVVRNSAYEPLRDATVELRVTSPDGRLGTLTAGPEPPPAGDGRFVGNFRAEQPGVFKITALASLGATTIGTATTSVLVGGADLEMTDPHLNGPLLSRLASASGGHPLTEDHIAGLPDMLKASVPAAVLAVRRDLWHTGWSFATILIMLGAEWGLRRQWGLR